MIYSDDIKEEIRSRNDIVSVISSYVSLKKSGSNYMGLCPFHNEKSPSFSVSASRQMYHCFGCGVSGDVFMFVEQYENYTFPEAMKYLADRVGIELPKVELSPTEKQRATVRQQLLDIQKQAAGYYYYLLHQPQGEHGYKYLRDRGLTDETIKRFGLGYCDAAGNGLYRYLKGKGFKDDILKQTGLFTYDERRGVYDKFWNRVMFPIMDTNNKVIAFGGRVMSDAKPKYLNSPETMLFDKSKNLFGINYARQARKGFFIICEGYMDVISLHQAGFDNAIAPLGTALTPLQANLVKRYMDCVYLSFDSDGAGTKAALKAIPIFKNAGISVKVINLKPYKDPDELIKAIGVEGYQKRIDDAMGSFYFEVQVEASEHDMQDPSDKTAFVNTIAKKLIAIDEEIERNIYADAFSEKYKVDPKEFRKLVNKLGANALINPQVFQNEEIKIKKERVTVESAIKLSQRILLTWIGDDENVYRKLKGIIEPQDFRDPLYRRAADIIFEQYANEKKATPAKIPGMFEDRQEQEEVAKIFTTDLNNELINNWGNEEKELTLDIKERAINQLVHRIKTKRIEEELEKTADFAVIAKCTQMKKDLQKMHISLE